MTKKNDTHQDMHHDTTQHTTYDTWGRVAQDQLERMTAWSEQATRMQLAAMDQVREFVGYSTRLATEWQSFMLDAGRKMAGQMGQMSKQHDS